MSELYEKSLRKLELDLVLQQLSDCASSTEGKAACLNLRPTADLEEVQALLDQTTAASDGINEACQKQQGTDNEKHFTCNIHKFITLL